MYRKVLITALLAAVAAPALASSIGLSDNDGNALAVTVAPGATFQLNVVLLSDVPLTGVGYYVQASSSNRFDVTGRSISGTQPFTDPTSTVFPMGLDPISLDLGSGAADVNTNQPAGTYQLGTITIAVDAATPEGNYTIQGVNAKITNAAFDEISIDPSAIYNISVAVPEPASLGIIGLAGLLMGRRRVA